jgi:hypothetical protein
MNYTSPALQNANHVADIHLLNPCKDSKGVIEIDKDLLIMKINCVKL